MMLLTRWIANIFIGVWIIYASACDNDKEMMRKGLLIVRKVEKFREERGYLPSSIEDIGIKESMQGPYFYERKDSLNYIIWYGTSLGESMIYYSDTKEWDYRLRAIPKEALHPS